MKAYPPAALAENPSDYDASAINTAAASLSRARNLLAAAMQLAAMAAIDAHHGGMPEARIAREIGVNRMTVRKWLKK